MRQVPYLIIGSGRMAKHMQYYLHLLQISYRVWSRKHNNIADLRSLSSFSDVILLLIKDNAIVSFIEQHPFLKDKKLVHFSGNLLLSEAWSVHPLMTFMPSLYDLERYCKIPFILQEDSPELSTLLPGLDNLSYRISNKMRSYYHAMCVMSGNFTTLLWQKFFDELEQRYGLPRDAAYPYLQQITSNLMHHAEHALTGPLIRNDTVTIANHLQALSGDEFKKIYQAFVDMYGNKTRK